MSKNNDLTADAIELEPQHLGANVADVTKGLLDYLTVLVNALVVCEVECCPRH